MRRLLLAALAAGFILIAFGGRASAYPQFQFSSGTQRCSQCHYAPDGGGLINSWGRDESGDTISLGGDGSFLHGAWQQPAWLALGVDIRLAALRNDTGGPESPEYAAFPMQSDVYARFKLGDHVSLYLQGGVRGDVGRDETVQSRFDSVSDRFISNDHYLLWQPDGPTGPYLRVGKYFTTFGLRFVEHIFYVQRYTGYDLYNETYNASGGYVAEDWEVHASLFTPPPDSFPEPFRSVGTHESGGVAYGEKRWNGMAMLGVQGRIGTNSEDTRYDVGAVGKLWVEQAKVLFLGEADFIRDQVSAAKAGENQLVSYLGATFFPVRGLMAGAAYEFYQEDLSVSGTAHNAVDVEVNFFPWAHFELLGIGQYQFYASGGSTPGGNSASLYMLQFHYYL